MTDEKCLGCVLFLLVSMCRRRDYLIYTIHVFAVFSTIQVFRFARTITAKKKVSRTPQFFPQISRIFEMDVPVFFHLEGVQGVFHEP